MIKNRESAKKYRENSLQKLNKLNVEYVALKTDHQQLQHTYEKLERQIKYLQTLLKNTK